MYNPRDRMSISGHYYPDRFPATYPDSLESSYSMPYSLYYARTRTPSQSSWRSWGHQKDSKERSFKIFQVLCVILILLVVIAVVLGLVFGMLSIGGDSNDATESNIEDTEETTSFSLRIEGDFDEALLDRNSTEYNELRQEVTEGVEDFCNCTVEDVTFFNGSIGINIVFLSGPSFSPISFRNECDERARRDTLFSGFIVIFNSIIYNPYCIIYSPCLNGGICTNLRGSPHFRCDCPTGTIGTICQKVIECAMPEIDNGDVTCTNQNGNTITTANPGYTNICAATCNSGYQPNVPHVTCLLDRERGYFDHQLECELTTSTSSCSAITCRNGSTCWPTQDGYFCDCLPGFSGENCQTTLYCSVPVVEHGSVLCFDSATGSVTSPPGYTDTCSVDCEDGYVQYLHFIACLVTEDTAYFDDELTCVETTVSGQSCQENSCNNNGDCVNTDTGFYCDCTVGYVGVTCNTEMLCTIPNVQHGSITCFDFSSGTETTFPGYADTCSVACDTGYESNYDFITCLIEDDEAGFDNALECTVITDVSCTDSTCDNNGVCIDTVSGPYCDCTPGYVGNTCETAHQFKLVEQEMTWEDANAYCEDTYGGHLAEPQTQEEFDIIKNLIPNDSHAWLGGNIQESLSDNIWRWFSSGDPIGTVCDTFGIDCLELLYHRDYENCLVMYEYTGYDLYWYDEPCNITIAFVCEFWAAN